jgi:hypothetical protein
LDEPVVEPDPITIRTDLSRDIGGEVESKSEIDRVGGIRAEGDISGTAHTVNSFGFVKRVGDEGLGVFDFVDGGSSGQVDGRRLV